MSVFLSATATGDAAAFPCTEMANFFVVHQINPLRIIEATLDL
jgi:hypothetical protein